MTYAKIVERLEKLAGSEILGDVGNKTEKFPLYILKRGKGKRVLISGGVHGDEPAGVYAVLSFFENHIQDYESDFEFTAFPCVNPWGFEHYKRSNSDNVNLNREFKKDSKAQEIKLILPNLESYLFTMDFHETMAEWDFVGDNEPDGRDPDEFYLWEICENKKIRVGQEIVGSVEKLGIPVCKWPKIYGDTNNGGVIYYPEDCGTDCYAEGTSFDTFSAANLSEQAFTIESFRDQDLEKRVIAHVTSLRTVLDEKLK